MKYWYQVHHTVGSEGTGPTRPLAANSPAQAASAAYRPLANEVSVHAPSADTTRPPPPPRARMDGPSRAGPGPDQIRTVPPSPDATASRPSPWKPCWATGLPGR